MRKLYKNEAGFSTVEALLILVVLVVIGAAGWFVYKDHHKTVTADKVNTSSSSKQAASSTSTSNTMSTQPANPYTNWQTYTDTSGSGFSVKYPSGWQSNPQSKAWAWTFTEKSNNQLS